MRGMCGYKMLKTLHIIIYNDKSKKEKTRSSN